MNVFFDYFVYKSYFLIGKQIHQYDKIISFAMSLPAEPYNLNFTDVETQHSKVKQLLPKACLLHFEYKGLLPLVQKYCRFC